MEGRGLEAVLYIRNNGLEFIFFHYLATEINSLASYFNFIKFIC